MKSFFLGYINLNILFLVCFVLIYLGTARKFQVAVCSEGNHYSEFTEICPYEVLNGNFIFNFRSCSKLVTSMKCGVNATPSFSLNLLTCLVACVEICTERITISQQINAVFCQYNKFANDEITFVSLGGKNICVYFSFIGQIARMTGS